MYQELRKAIERPPLYKKMAEAFWDDAYISKQMLKAHLDSDFEGVERLTLSTNPFDGSVALFRQKNRRNFLISVVGQGSMRKNLQRWGMK